MKTLFTVTTLFFTAALFAQDANLNDDITNFNRETIYRLNILSPSVEIEKDITDNISILGNIGVGIAIASRSNSGSTQTDFLFPVILEASGRYYINFKRRADKGKITQYNSGNFIGLNLIKVFESTGDISRVDGQTIITPVYGLQRTYRDILTFTFEAGPSFDFEDNGSGFGAYVGVQIGFTL